MPKCKNFNLKEKVVIITGGVGLIGQEFVKAVLENNGIAIIADIEKQKGIQLKNLLGKTNGSNVDYFQLDITEKRSLNDCIYCLNNKYGRIDALVNNAYPRNKNYGNKFFDVEYSDFTENIGLHLGGYFNTSKHFAMYFEKQGYGNIINISSIYGTIPPKFEIYEDTKMTMPVEYAVVKSGLIHLTKYMSKYFKGKNIRVNTISPGGVLNNQPKKFLEMYKNLSLNKGLIEKSDLNGTLIYLLSDMSLFVNGQNIVVDDGFSL